jgi:membrane protein
MSLITPFQLIINVARRFHSERLVQTAAALSFATLLSLVPMIVVTASLIKHLPFAEGIVSALEHFLLANLLPEKAGVVVAQVVGQFADHAGRLTQIGIAVLAITALMQMLTIEYTFNAIWKIRAPRFLPRRITMHILVLLLGPLIVGAGLMAVTYLVSASLGLLAEAPWGASAVLRVLSFLLMAMLLTLAYWGVPNRAVSVGHAAVGGFLAAAGFLALQKLFALYVVGFPSYTMIYGSFVAMPIFLIWLYASWTVILAGALVTAELPDATRS